MQHGLSLERLRELQQEKEAEPTGLIIHETSPIHHTTSATLLSFRCDIQPKPHVLRLHTKHVKEPGMSLEQDAFCLLHHLLHFKIPSLFRCWSNWKMKLTINTINDIIKTDQRLHLLSLNCLFFQHNHITTKALSATFNDSLGSFNKLNNKMLATKNGNTFSKQKALNLETVNT